MHTAQRERTIGKSPPDWTKTMVHRGTMGRPESLQTENIGL